MDTPQPDTPFPELSRREREIAMLLAAGMKNGAIAAHAGISIKTVDTHRTTIIRKLKLDDGKSNANVMLTRYAIRNGWMKP